MTAATYRWGFEAALHFHPDHPTSLQSTVHSSTSFFMTSFPFVQDVQF
jgi:hypothetical protein